ncbi:type II/IV secretion system protein [Candidatus Parcubacteria bacterium]|nr:MAG: type II/IV secretion system protein [Candidatus Parcubacteria bacterium]
MDAATLLQALRERNVLDERTARSIGKEVALTGRSVEELLYERKIAQGGEVAKIKSELLGVPYEKVNPDAIGEDLLQLVPEETASSYLVIPLALQKEERLLVAGMVHPDDEKAKDALRFIARKHGFNLGVYLISYEDWRAVMKKYSPYQASVKAAIEALSLKKGESSSGMREKINLEEASRTVEEEGPVIRIVADTLREAVNQKASDVHIEPQQNYLRVRFRVDGNLKQVAELPLELSGPVVSRIKVMSRLKIDETRIPQDGRFRADVFGREIDFRVSTFPTAMGEKVAVRILDPTVGLRTLATIGFSARNLAVIQRAIRKPFGLILITGPTGSGKTTTNYALLQELNDEKVNIVSLEDPVEYSISGLNQSQVRPEIGYTFASGLRQILRQDPDVILVGEIRDEETAELAIHASLTGHVVLATLHTNNAVGAIPRLIDMKVRPFLIPAALNVVIAQRLVAKLCESCRKPFSAPPEAQEIIGKALEPLPPELVKSYHAPYQIYRAEGCEKCKGKGTKGRVPIFEVAEMTKEIKQLIYNSQGSVSALEILKIAREQGMITLREDGVLKALAGEIAFEEVLRETEESI